MDIETLRREHPEHWMRAGAIRALTLDAVAAAKSGHSGMPMGMADVATVLYSRHLKFSAAHPHWADRDRFILSAGHGSMLLYSLLHLTGSPEMTIEELRNFRQWGANTPGHPEVNHAPGIETTTGPLGQGLATSVGFAMAEEMLRARWGEDLVDHRTWVIAGDGCLMEGVSHEAIALAGMQRLSRLTVLFDDNRITIDGPVDLADRTDQMMRFEACGWATFECDGHDPDDIERALSAAMETDAPAMVRCRTHIALGSAAQDTAKGHGALTDAKVVQDTKDAYGWVAGPFEVPSEIKLWWEEVGRRGAQARGAWEERLAALPDARRAEWTRQHSGEPPRKLASTIKALKRQAIETPHAAATRKSSEAVLEVLAPIMPEAVGGSADLTGSNNTRVGGMEVFGPDDRTGRYVHYGIREHGMAAAMNGLTLHGGLRPYGGTFLCFSDYARPAIRLSALMGTPVIYVMSHDSIGLGEDGPTHQPVEHLAMLRATPNMLVVRPADMVETAEAWQVAIEQTNRPIILALSRQNLAPARDKAKGRNLVAQGAYVLAEAEGRRQALLMASGSEVEIAMAAREMLQADGIGARVVSMPCMELFAAQEESYRRRVLPGGPVRVAVEAGVRQPWDRWLLGERGREAKAAFVGMTQFGASAPAERLYEGFGITAEAVAEAARGLL